LFTGVARSVELGSDLLRCCRAWPMRINEPPFAVRDPKLGSTPDPTSNLLAVSLRRPPAPSDEEGSNRPSRYSCRGWAPTPISSQPGGDLRHLAPHAAAAASFNPQTKVARFGGLKPLIPAISTPCSRATTKDRRGLDRRSLRKMLLLSLPNCLSFQQDSG
jgi:hypothetical protein